MGCGGGGGSLLLLLLLLLPTEAMLGLLTVRNPADFFRYGGREGVNPCILARGPILKNHSVVTFRAK